MEANCAPWMSGFGHVKDARMSIIIEDTYWLAGLFRERTRDAVTNSDLLLDEPECHKPACRQVKDSKDER